ncbi:PucR family transcriptional regulator ligand-binding domain-containing protein, partial [Kitasatospora sp. NPDC059571]|uniref:PucR family transcriptional regulator ligand-binding domain-containing protein n=1 Tax=Kitasatospora sp. NPDC059571 TaxID=3346871 RepID=UPI00367888C0
MPALTVREILAFDVLGPAAPVLLAGRSGLERGVRWVHSSEVYEGCAFLYGGELLLTNGYGLARASADRQRGYVRELAARAAAALFVEVGRTLPDMPPAVTAECERVGLPLVALRRVVPFVRIAEAVNTAIVSLSLAERTTRRFRGSAHTAPGSADHGRALLADLLDGAQVGRAEAAARAELAGFRPPAGCPRFGRGAGARGGPPPAAPPP